MGEVIGWRRTGKASSAAYSVPKRVNSVSHYLKSAAIKPAFVCFHLNHQGVAAASIVVTENSREARLPKKRPVIIRVKADPGQPQSAAETPGGSASP
jgi:hypothetical protein